MKYFLISQDFFSRQFARFPRECGKKAYNLFMRKLSAMLRVNILAGLKSANHGWLGASFSSVELMSVIYNNFIPRPLENLPQRNALILSKGHAVVAQYAILGALKAFPIERILEYKALDGLPAHCDRETPGVDSDSGSLGQGLSKGIGLSLVNRHQQQPFKTFVILGDGELQEGQVFEAFLTLVQKKISNCIPIIDRNSLQSDSSTRDIKDAADWEQVFSGIGLRVFKVDGHNPGEIRKVLNRACNSGVPSVIIAKTRKGYGTSLTEMSRKIGMRQGIWHGRIPNDAEYLGMVSELVQGFQDPELQASFELFKSKFVSTKPAKAAQATSISTSAAYGEALITLAKERKNFFVLDADLEKACKLTAFARSFPDRFVEVGISEQDMVSIAAGIGLGKKIGIVNTYASFYKRCLDQVFCASAEKLPLILAGHYSGLDYFTDGKTHQCLTDVGLMRATGNVKVFEPLTPEETVEILSFFIKKMSREIERNEPTQAIYLKLHRTPVPENPKLPGKFKPGSPYIFESRLKKAPDGVLFVSGPHMLHSALLIQRKFDKEKTALKIAAISSFSESTAELRELLMNTKVPMISLEDNLPSGGLGDFLASLGEGHLKRISASRIGGSSRGFEDMLKSQGLSEQQIYNDIKKAIKPGKTK